MKQSFIWIAVIIIVMLGGIWLLMGQEEEIPSNDGSKSSKEAESTTQSDSAAENTTAEADISGTVQQLNLEQSNIAWSASRLAATPHTGTVSLSDGSVTMSNGVVMAADFTADMTTITESKNSGRFLQHLRSDDFFAVDQFPTAKFTLTNATTNTWTGTMTIRGQSNEISLPVNVSVSSGQTTITTDFQIDRTRWGITFDSASIFQNLGNKAIKDEIDLSINLVLDR